MKKRKLKNRRRRKMAMFRRYMKQEKGYHGRWAYDARAALFEEAKAKACATVQRLAELTGVLP